MATYNQERIIKEYWDRVKHLYPTVSFEKFSEACKYPAIFIKNIIKSGSLKTIMIKWVGKFIVYPARFKRELTRKEIFFNKGIITEEEYLDYKQKYETLMEKYLEPSPGFILINDLDEDERLQKLANMIVDITVPNITKDSPITKLEIKEEGVTITGDEYNWKIPDNLRDKLPVIVGTAGELDNINTDIFYNPDKNNT